MSEIRDRILGLASRFGIRKVTIEGIGGDVWIRPASIRCVAKMGELAAVDQVAAGAALIVDCLVDETGQAIMTDPDMPTVLAWPVALYNDVLSKVQVACGMTGVEIEDARKNSTVTP